MTCYLLYLRYAGFDAGGERRVDFREAARSRTGLRVSRPEMHQ